MIFLFYILLEIVKIFSIAPHLLRLLIAAFSPQLNTVRYFSQGNFFCTIYPENQWNVLYSPFLREYFVFVLLK